MFLSEIQIEDYKNDDLVFHLCDQVNVDVEKLKIPN